MFDFERQPTKNITAKLKWSIGVRSNFIMKFGQNRQICIIDKIVHSQKKKCVKN